ncbi:hypothetical protein DFH05DRAFT_1426951 [Lentinula detonsa]|uniref:Uncharacterized protein n=1 Tax=Lentinula detonsa TaxID=2804962 RepID=A0A9W8TSR2_9AGAR|nr:hypothetical protein DFH05DRAFT_1426951 [Lentinula detonsa]
MSRLTASLFHKPSPFEFPRAPLSPPETMSDHLGSAHPTTISVVGAMPVESSHVDAEPAFHSPSPEPAAARFRRVSSLAYHSSGLRENRERAVQRSSKFFVVVIPPPALLQEHGQLGHTLSLGPKHRLSQGMLLPLFPTMYGQLSAIAKEFNFPSTTGICLYFHFTENGITATPRISDESWQMIWSNVFDPSTPLSRVPIVGKLEFDIDLRHARWYSAWIASSHREHVDVPASVGPSTAPSLAHFRGDSRNTELEINFQDDQLDSDSVSPPSITRHGRHVPRKLSLVDRLDSSLRVVASSVPQISPERSGAASAHVLSPIFQEDEPKTARLEDSLAKRVKSWRASASLTPSALAAKGQTSLEPANLPNTMSLDDVANGEDLDELNLEDFAWSVSSLGPNDWEEGSVASGPRLPSIHLANRMESSVCMTPSICTSLGPSDYTLPSPIPSFARVMTPDIAHRMFEDCPPTPTTATSWGPPSEYPASPMSFSRVSSVDLGERAVFSPPPTPMTATSWGPSSEYPPSPMSFGRAPSVHLGDRLVFSPPPTPSTATSWGPASWPASPVTPFYVYTPDIGQRAFDPEDLVLPGAPWNQVWPYNQQHLEAPSAPWSQVWPYTSSWTPEVELTTQNDAPWGHSWPYHSYAIQSHSSVLVHLPCSYPSLKIYPSVYPYFDLYPAEPSSVDRISYLTSADIYPVVDEHRPLNKVINVNVASAWPVFEIYPPVAISEQSHRPSTSRELTSTSIRLPCSYPSLKIYPSVYPYFDDLYPAEPQTEPTPYLSSLDVYPAVNEGQQSHRVVHVAVASAWPVFEIYPPMANTKQSHSSSAGQGNSPVSVHLPCSYPSLRIYPSVYPYLDDIYPADPSTVSFYPDSLNIYPAVNGRQQENKLVLVKVASAWPNFEIYPPVANIEQYQNARASQGFSPISVRIPCSYPSLKIYPSVYPHFDDLYPAEPRVEEIAAYPQFSIYPSLNRQHSDIAKRHSAIEQLSLKPRVLSSTPYPLSVFEIYPPVQAEEAATLPRSGEKPIETVVQFPWAYPIIDLYPTVYPHITPYPSAGSTYTESSTCKVPEAAKSRQYPDFLLYPCRQYPDFDFYPPQDSKDVYASKTASRYGVFDLYPAVYPHILPYPPVISVIRPSISLSGRRVVRSHNSLHAEVFPDDIVSTPTGTLSGIGRIVLEKPRVHRSHRELHDVVFSDGVISTPSGMFSLRNSRNLSRPEVPPRPVGARLRSGSISQRPLSSVAPLVTHGLPPRPNFRLSTYNGSAPAPAPTPDNASIGTLDRGARSVRSLSTPFSAPLPIRSSTPQAGVPTKSSTGPALQNTAPLRRVASSSVPTKTSSLRGANPGLEPVSELASPALERSASMGLRRPVIPPNSVNVDPRIVHRKRDSVVIQRIRAFEEAEPDSPRRSLSKTLKEFPLPPPPPPPTGGLPPVPTHRTSSLVQPRS